ncbi:MAG: hypothetical protein AB7S93_19350 [Xanthobacteraceae bacterium]|jgi:hypothetical protein
MNNSTLLTADRTTHLKIVVLALVGATLVAGIGVASRITDTAGRLEATAPVVKAAAPMTAAARERTFIR